MNNLCTAVVPREVALLHRAFCRIARVPWPMNDLRCRAWMEWLAAGRANRPPNGWSVEVLESGMSEARRRAPRGHMSAEGFWWLIARPEDFAALRRPTSARGLGFQAAPPPTAPPPAVAGASGFFRSMRAKVAAAQPLSSSPGMLAATPPTSPPPHPAPSAPAPIRPQ